MVHSGKKHVKFSMCFLFIFLIEFAEEWRYQCSKLGMDNEDSSICKVETN